MRRSSVVQGHINWYVQNRHGFRTSVTNVDNGPGFSGKACMSYLECRQSMEYESSEILVAMELIALELTEWMILISSATPEVVPPPTTFSVARNKSKPRIATKTSARVMSSLR